MTQHAAERLRAAAERLTAAEYDHQYWDGNRGEHQPFHDAIALADAYLAEHDTTPLDANWLRSITSLPVCKNGSGGYSDNKVTLFLNDWESSQNDRERFWVLSFSDCKDKGWMVDASVQDDNRHAGTLWLANVKTRGDVLRVLAVFGIQLAAAGGAK